VAAAVFIELAEYLKCPEEHEDAFLVLATGAMKGRAIRYGTLGCPVCQAEYLVVQQAVRFGRRPAMAAPVRPLPAPDAVQALIGLESPGGYVTLVGSAAGLAHDLAGLMRGVHFICLNAPAGVEPSVTRSLLEATATIPLRASVVRGVVLGEEYARPSWLAEGARVVLRGQRVVACAEGLAPPPGLVGLASGQGMWVGRKDG
jgi:hypothetical protein